MSQSVVTEQPSSVPMYRLVQVTPGSDVTASSHLQSCSKNFFVEADRRKNTTTFESRLEKRRVCIS